MKHTIKKGEYFITFNNGFNNKGILEGTYQKPKMLLSILLDAYNSNCCEHQEKCCNFSNAHIDREHFIFWTTCEFVPGSS